MLMVLLESRPITNLFGFSRATRRTMLSLAAPNIELGPLGSYLQISGLEDNHIMQGCRNMINMGIAQSAERVVWDHEAAGSIPASRILTSQRLSARAGVAGFFYNLI